MTNDAFTMEDDKQAATTPTQSQQQSNRKDSLCVRLPKRNNGCGIDVMTTRGLTACINYGISD